jgi:23S rRNA (adenine2503-C2)-methyltransferase
MYLSNIRKMSVATAALSCICRIRICQSFIVLVRPAAPMMRCARNEKYTVSQHPFGFRLARATTSSESNAVNDDSTLEEWQQQQRQPLTPMVNLYTIEESELESLLKAAGHQSYRAKQVLRWVRKQGAVSVEQMVNLPMKLRQDLMEWTSSSSASPKVIGGALTEITSQVSKDGTIKRLYALNNSNNNNVKVSMIESVLMPYEDGRYTACISSQAGCAMGCKFCATGQMGFTRQLSAEEIYEQVARFDAQLRSTDSSSTGVSNVVFMGMGEPLANYNNVMKAVRLIRDRLQISARKITISTVGVVPKIRKLILEKDDLQVRLAVSLHCASDKERSNLIPANERYGGLTELLTSVQEYTEQTKRRITFEWALIDGQNDSLEEARTLGRLLTQGETQIRRDLIHINVIPLNPTGGYGGTPTGRSRVDAFLRVLTDDFHISATPRVRRGIDIDAGCGQLKAKQENKYNLSGDEKGTLPKKKEIEPLGSPMKKIKSPEKQRPVTTSMKSQKSTTPTNNSAAPKSDENDDNDKKRRRALIKNLKMIEKLKDMKATGALTALNAEQNAKISKEDTWRTELKYLEEKIGLKTCI